MTSPFLFLTITSIEKNAASLAGQLADYDFLYVTEEERAQLEKIEKELHALVKQITERQS